MDYKKELKEACDKFENIKAEIIKADLPVYVIGDIDIHGMVKKEACDIFAPNAGGIIIYGDQCGFENVFFDKDEALEALKKCLDAALDRIFSDDLTTTPRTPSWIRDEARCWAIKLSPEAEEKMAAAKRFSLDQGIANLKTKLAELENEKKKLGN